MRTSNEHRSIPPEVGREGEKRKDITRVLGEATFAILTKVSGVLSTMPKGEGRKHSMEWALSLAAALKKGVGEFAKNGIKLPPAAKDRSTFLEALKMPSLAGIVFMNALAGASPAEAKSMKANLEKDTRTRHELIVDMKNDPTIRQFVPEKKPYEAILYGADEQYPQLKEWITKHPNVKRIEVSEFRAAIQHTHDDSKRTHKSEAQVTLTARVFLKNGTHKTITVLGIGQGLPVSLNYYAMESSQKFGEIMKATKMTPDVHKQKSPFYDDNDGYMDFFIGTRFAKQNAIKKLFEELDTIAGEPKKSK